MIQKWPPFAYTCLYKKKWTKNWQIPPQCVGQIDNCTTLYYQRHWFGQKQLIHSFTEELRSNLKKRILSSLAKNLWKFLLVIFIDQINLYSYLVFFFYFLQSVDPPLVPYLQLWFQAYYCNGWAEKILWCCPCPLI